MRFVLIKRDDLSETFTINDVVVATVYMSNINAWIQLIDSFGGVHRFPLSEYIFQVDKCSSVDDGFEDNDDWG